MTRQRVDLQALQLPPASGGVPPAGRISTRSSARTSARRVLPALCLLIGLAALQDKARANDTEAPARWARVVEASGTVWVLDRESRAWTPIGRNHPLTQGDRLLTDRGARAEIAVGSTTLRVDTQTEVELIRLDGERADVHLHAGSLAVRVQAPRAVDSLAWATDMARFTPLRPGNYRIDHYRIDPARQVPGRADASPGLSYATTWIGQMRVQQAGVDAWMLDGGQRAEIRPDGRHTRTVSSTGAWPRDAFSQWIAGRERDEGLSLDSLGDADGQSFNETWETTGWNELDRYGAWDSHPDLGRVWSPRQVPQDWQPYRYGRWVWVSPWGWSWVDDAPWGFAPSHAGQWVQWRDRWFWSPGGAAGRNYAYPYPYPHNRPPPRPTYPRPVPTGPISAGAVPSGPVPYTGQGVPAGIITVPADALAPRQPISGPSRPINRPSPAPVGAERPRIPGTLSGRSGPALQAPEPATGPRIQVMPVRPPAAAPSMVPAPAPTPSRTPSVSPPPAPAAAEPAPVPPAPAVRSEPPRRTVTPPVRNPQRDRLQVQ